MLLCRVQSSDTASSKDRGEWRDGGSRPRYRSSTTSNRARFKPFGLTSSDCRTSCLAVDGGLVMNNPTAAAVTHVLHNKRMVYNNLLEACVHMNSLNHASECLDLMKQQGVGKNAITYSCLVQLAVLQRDISVVREIWKEYINCHSPSFMTVRKFIWSFTRLQDLQSTYVALQQMIAVALQQNDSITETIDGRMIDISVDIPIPFHSLLYYLFYCVVHFYCGMCFSSFISNF